MKRDIRKEKRVGWPLPLGQRETVHSERVGLPSFQAGRMVTESWGFLQVQPFPVTSQISQKHR